MENEILLLGNFIGAILQSLYFCLFLFAVKQIKTDKFKFILLCVIDYFIVQNFIKFNLGVYADVIYAIIFYVNLKIIYKNKARITDFITYIISNFLLGITSVLSVLTFGISIYTVIISNCFAIFLVYIFKNKISKLENFYNKFWNRHSDKNMLKSVTIRGFSSVATMFLFITLHFWMAYLLLR